MIAGPWRAVSVLGVTQIIAWGTIFYSPVLTAPLIDLTGFAATPTARITVRAMLLAGFGSLYVPKGEVGIMDSRPFADNILTSDPVRYARNAAILEAEPLLALGPLAGVIDNAVIVLENIFRHMEMGEAPEVAAEKGGDEVALAVLAATLTSSVMFFPVTFLYGVSRFLFSALALAVVLALFA